MCTKKKGRWKNLAFNSLVFLLRILKQIFLLNLVRKK